MKAANQTKIVAEHYLESATKNPHLRIEPLNQSYGSKSAMDDVAKSDNQSNNSEKGRKAQLIQSKNKYTLKVIIQNLLKNYRNLFTKTDAFQPKEMLLRTTVIKKLILYLILLFIALSTSYLGYINVYMQYSAYEFKVDSVYKVTRYHNLTVAVLNEYYHRDAINSRPLDSLYNSTNRTSDLKEVSNRIETFRDLLNSFDIDYNVRQDLFFRNLAQQELNFVVRYSENLSEVRQASRYTILIIMLEKLLTIDRSEFDKNEAFFFINDNFLSIMDDYLLSSFEASFQEAEKIIADSKASFL